MAENSGLASFFQALWQWLVAWFKKLFAGSAGDGQYNNPAVDAQLAEVSKGVTGDATVILGQSYLCLLKFPIGNYGPNQNGVDGIAGPALQAAVKLFQTMDGIQSSGELDAATMARLKTIVYSEQTIKELAKNAEAKTINITISTSATKAEFVNAVYYYALLDEEDTAVPASVTVVQAVLESGYGQSVPVDRATGRYSYNLFGIKGIGPAGTVQDYSWEENSATGKWEKVLAQFKAYASFADSIKGHSQFLLENKRYALAFKTKTAQEFAKAIAEAGYATDSNYAAKLIALMAEWGLD